MPAVNDGKYKERVRVTIFAPFLFESVIIVYRCTSVYIGRTQYSRRLGKYLEVHARNILLMYS
jgi:hypothetical protein